MTKLIEQADVLAGLTRDLSHCCVSKESEIFARYGLSAGEGHLILIVADEGSISPSIVAARLGVSRSRLTPLAQSLVEKGYLDRAESADDRRVRDLSLTPQGKKAAREAAQFRRDFHVRLLTSFSEGGRTQLIESLRLLHERMTSLRCEILESNGNGDSH